MVDLWGLIPRPQELSQALAAWVTVGVAFIGVVVAAVYAYLTWLPAGAARDQAAASTVAAQAAQEQAVASRLGAQAAGAQAETTRLAFEAVHRPYLQVEMVSNASFFERADFFALRFGLSNHGPVPAILGARQMRVRVGGALVAERPPMAGDSSWALFAGMDPVSFDFVERPEGGRQQHGIAAGVEVECGVGYRGLHDRPYVTRVVLTSTERGRWVYKDVQVTWQLCGVLCVDTDRNESVVVEDGAGEVLV